MYKLSRYWNRVAYFFIRLGQKMIWDYMGRNADLLTDSEFAGKGIEDILCDRDTY